MQAQAAACPVMEGEPWHFELLQCWEAAIRTTPTNMT